MKNQARNHHYISQGYLRGFGIQESPRQYYAHVTDITLAKTFKANIKNVFSERDFLRIEQDGLDPNEIENRMGQFESVAIAAIRRIIDSGQAQGADLDLVLNLMSLFAARSPIMRENMRNFHEQLAKKVIDMTLAVEEKGLAQQGESSASKRFSRDDLAKVKAFVDQDQYRVELHREYQMATEFKMMTPIFSALQKRSWTLLQTLNSSEAEFITTNRPVTLTYSEPEKIPQFYRSSPGFGLSNTEVFFPLTKHAMLIGTWGEATGTGMATDELVAKLNTHMITHCFGKVVSRKDKIFYYDPVSNEVRHDDVLLDRLGLWKSQFCSYEQ